MSFGLPPGAAPWWAIYLLAVLGAGVGAWLSRALADASYRRPQERRRPKPRHTSWLVIGVALAWGSLTFRLGGQAHWSLLPAYLYLGAVGAALIVVDLDVRRLPDLIVLPSYPIAFVLLLIPTVVTGQWAAVLRAVLAGLALYVGYRVLAVVSGGEGPGMGDAKLAGVLGLLLGWLGWGPVIVSVLAAFILGAAGALILLLAGRASRSSQIAFGPAMLLGAWVALMFPVQPVSG